MSNGQLSINNNQLPERYKQTEAGVIPEDWEVSSVGQEFEIQLGKMLDAQKNTGIFKPYIGNRTVQWGYFDIGDLPQMAMSRSDMEKFRLEVGDLIVCEGGEVGRAAIWDTPLEECYYQKALHRLRAKNGFSSQLMVAFLKYWTDFDLLSNYVSQTSIAHLTKEKFSQVPLPVPSVEEQRAITATLSDVDALIAALDKLIAKQRHLKTATMQQLLTGKKRLPGFGEEKGYKQTEVGLIPEDWAIFPLKKLTSFIGSGKSTVNKDSISIYPLYGSTGMIGYSFTCDYEGDAILVARVGANAGTINFVTGKYGVSDNTIIVKLNQDSDLHFFLYQLYGKNLNSLVFGSGQPLITGTQLKNLEMLTPKLSEQRAIATVLSDMDAAISALETRRAKTQAIKQGMMQELLTGRTRLV